jgi:hypothetical protein
MNHNTLKRKGFYMKAFLIGTVLGLVTSTCFAGILPTSRGGTGANITPVAGKFVFSTSSGLSIANSVPSGGTLVMSAGTTVASGAPFTIPAGSTLATREKGALESDGTDLYWTDKNGTRWKLSRGTSN